MPRVATHTCARCRKPTSTRDAFLCAKCNASDQRDRMLRREAEACLLRAESPEWIAIWRAVADGREVAT